MSDSILDRHQGFWQFLKFAMVGFFNTLISEGIYAFLIFFKVHYLPASFIGFSLSVLNAYFWNSRYVFKEQEGAETRVWWKVLGKTYVAYFWGYLANAALLVFWIDILKIERWVRPLGDWCLEQGYASLDAVFWGNLLAAFINLIITVPMNFFINKHWAYRQKKKAD